MMMMTVHMTRMDPNGGLYDEFLYPALVISIVGRKPRHDFRNCLLVLTLFLFWTGRDSYGSLHCFRFVFLLVMILPGPVFHAFRAACVRCSNIHKETHRVIEHPSTSRRDFPEDTSIATTDGGRQARVQPSVRDKPKPGRGAMEPGSNHICCRDAKEHCSCQIYSPALPGDSSFLC